MLAVTNPARPTGQGLIGLRDSKRGEISGPLQTSFLSPILGLRTEMAEFPIRL